MNHVALVGNLASDPELRQTSSGRPVCTFRLAVSRAGGKEADFVTIVTWERQAEICNEYLRTGRLVAVDGRLHHSTWETEGTKRSRVEVIAHRVDMLGARPRTAEAESPFDAMTEAERGEVAEQVDELALA